MKSIATAAAVSQALLHYHFGTKDQLYGQVIRHRSKKINDERHARLDAVDLRGANAVRDILLALFRPPLGPAGGAEGWPRIFARLVAGREDQQLVRECYDPTARRFIAALEQAIPGANRATAAMSYTLALGALIAVIGRDGRVERLMGRSDSAVPLATDEILDGLIRFTAGGIESLNRSAAIDNSPPDTHRKTRRQA